MGAAGSTMSTGVPCNAPFDAGGGWEACDQMLFHRKSAGTCPGTLPERSTRNDGINASQLEPGACTQDRHCTDGPNGYCQSNLCIYRCLQDSDCSDTQICFCVEQMCITASCSTDEDCGERLACEATQPDPDLPYQAACQTAQ